MQHEHPIGWLREYFTPANWLTIANYISSSNEDCQELTKLLVKTVSEGSPDKMCK